MWVQCALCLTPLMHLILIFRSAATTVVLNTTCHCQETRTKPCGTVIHCTNVMSTPANPISKALKNVAVTATPSNFRVSIKSLNKWCHMVSKWYKNYITMALRWRCHLIVSCIKPLSKWCNLHKFCKLHKWCHLMWCHKYYQWVNDAIWYQVMS